MKSTQLSLVPVSLYDFQSFPDRRRMREAWKQETSVRPQFFSSEWAVKYIHVGRTTIQISPPLGEQGQSKALSRANKDNETPTPCPAPPPHRHPPRWHDIDKCITNKHVVYGVMESRRIRGTELYRQLKTLSCTLQLESNFSLNQAWPQWPR